MKRLTMNQVARASLKANRKAYRSLIITVFLAVYLATVAVLGCYGTYLAKEAQAADRIGVFDCFMIGQPEMTDEQLRDSGLFSRIGHVYLTAQIEETGIYTGYYDETGSELLRHRCVEGRMPETAGEIAIEQSALEAMRSDLQVGDTVTWVMNPINGIAEERTYTLTGILNEQTTYLDVSRNYSASDTVVVWPAALVAAEEPAYAVGTAQVDRVMTYAPLVFYSQVDRYGSEKGHMFHVFPVSRSEMKAAHWDPLLEDTLQAAAQMVLWLIMGGCLLLATGVGISGAMEGVLSRRTEEIGMLRAVGATRRQIKRLFSRDAWIITAAALPGGILLGILTVWVITRFSSDGLRFGLSPWLILPVAGVSALCVFLFSRLPLRRASRQTPMGVLRDTGMLRKAKKFKSKTVFRATRLISGRQAFLHPFRQAGAAVMITLMLINTSFVVEMGMNSLDELKGKNYDFSLTSRDLYISGRLFSQAVAEQALTDQDIDQIAAIAEVQSVRYTREGTVNLILRGEIPKYLQDTYIGEYQAAYYTDGIKHTYSAGMCFNVASMFGDGSLKYLLLEEMPEAPTGQAAFMGLSDRDYYKYMQIAQETAGINGKLLEVKIFVIDPDDPAIRQAVAEGEIDPDALNAGREILVYAPDQYVGRKLQQQTDESPYVDEAEKKSDDEVEWVAENHNDYFAPGQQLELLQLLDTDIEKVYWGNEENTRKAYAAMEQREATVTVGAVLKGEWWKNTDTVSVITTDMAFLTTREGANALGFSLNLSPQPHQIRIRLNGTVDAETEETVQKKLERIAMRGNMTLYNALQYNRETVRKFWQGIALLSGIALIFFIVSVTMQVGNIGRRIRADQRMIGTLRAVGADGKALLGCYRLPLILASAVGLAIGIVIYLFIRWRFELIFPKYHPAIVLPLFAVLCVLCCVCCLAGVRTRLRQVLNQSVVENIREL